MKPTTDVDLLAPEAVRDPYTPLARLREEQAVVFAERHGAWLVTRFDDVESALIDRRLSSDRVSPVLDRVRQEGEDAASGRSEILGIIKSWMVVTDPPEHTRLRKLAAGAFKNQRISEMVDDVRGMVGGVLDDFIAGGERDLIHHVAYPIPASVIAQMIGAPVEDRDAFRAWSDELALVAFGAGGDARSERHQRALEGLRQMFAYLQELVDEAREHPGDDMISDLAAPVEDGDRLDDDELLSMLALLLFAGHETTINATANGVLALLRHPEQLQLLREDPDLLPRAVEELLRLDGPIKVLHRWAREELEIGGTTIPAGDRVLLALASANHDPEQFAAPDEVDVTRYPNRHMAFGRGIHACVGAQLARLEMRYLLEGIIDRLPDLALAPDAELEYVPTLSARGLRHLPVTYSS